MALFATNTYSGQEIVDEEMAKEGPRGREERAWVSETECTAKAGGAIHSE